MSVEQLRTILPKLEEEAGILQQDKTNVHHVRDDILLERAKNASEQVLRRKWPSDTEFGNDEQVSELLHLFFTVLGTPKTVRDLISRTQRDKIEFLKKQVLSYVPKPISRREPRSEWCEWKPLSACTTKLFFPEKGNDEVRTLEVALSKRDRSDIMKYLVTKNGNTICVAQFIDLKFNDTLKNFSLCFSSFSFVETNRRYKFNYVSQSGEDQKQIITDFFARCGTKVGPELKCGPSKDQILQQYRACDASMLNASEIFDGHGNAVKNLMDFRF